MPPRLHSHNGCVTCRMRKKKCGEEKPRCSNCVRLSLSCAYRATGSAGSVPGRVVNLGRRQIGVPLYLVRQLPVCSFATAHEEASFERIPLVFSKFYNPLCQRIGVDTAALMQVAISDCCVRQSALACSSTALSFRGDGSYEIDRVAFGKAIQEVNRRISCPNQAKKDLFGLLLAVFFLGIIESLESSVAGNEDLSVHFKPGITLVGIYQDLFQDDWTGLPRGLCLLVLEGFLYFGAQSHFTPDLCSLEAKWRKSHVFETLMSLNPPGIGSAAQSPALCGQYEVFQMVFDVMFILRTPVLSRKHIDELELLKINAARVQARLPDELVALRSPQQSHENHIESIYQMYCHSLLICIESLLASLQTRDKLQLGQMISCVLDRFLSYDITPANYSFMLWPVHVLGCAISEDGDFERFLRQVHRCEGFMNPGHRRRLQLLTANVAKGRKRLSSLNMPSQVSDITRPQTFWPHQVFTVTCELSLGND